MDAVPLWLRVGLAAMLVATIAAAFLGRPPRRPARPAAIRLAVLAACASYAGAVAALIGGQAALSAGLVGFGVEALSVAAWLGRAPSDGRRPADDGDDDGGGGGPGRIPPDRWGRDDDRAFWREVEQTGRRRAPARR